MSEYEDELEKLKTDFLTENDGLIEKVEKVEKVEKIDDENLPKVSNVLRSLKKHYQESKDIFQYAEAQLGLARFLDFNFPDSALKTLKGHTNSIAVTAWKIIFFSKNICGAHEAHACVSGVFQSNCAYEGKYLSWPDLSFVDALNFSFPARPVIKPKGTMLYRVVEANGNKTGHWWFEVKPTSLRQWRSEYAVLEAWNAAGECVIAEVTDELSVWQGKTAAQKVYLLHQNPPFPSTNCYLEGGGIQIWLNWNKKNIKLLPGGRWP